MSNSLNQLGKKLESWKVGNLYSVPQHSMERNVKRKRTIKRGIGRQRERKNNRRLGQESSIVDV